MNSKVIIQMAKRTRRLAAEKGPRYVIRKVPAGAEILWKVLVSAVGSTFQSISTPELHFKNKRRDKLADEDEYAEFGPDHDALFEQIETHCDSPDLVLDLGCGAGSHLGYLYENGYTDLYGIDINEAKIELMEAAFPEMYAVANVTAGPAQEYLREFDDGHFDVVYSIATLQHIQSNEEALYDELVRVTDGILITFEIDREAFESGRDTAELSFGWHLNAELRDYREIFEPRGLTEVDAVKPWDDQSGVGPLRNGLYTLRVFRA